MTAAIAAAILSYPEIDPVLVSFGPFAIRWYSLAYIAGLLFAWWYITRLTGRKAAPMAPAHVDDFLIWAVGGVIVGGRIGYVLFYNLPLYAAHPLEALKVWDGGMSFHGGLAGVSIAAIWFCRRNHINLMAFSDHLAIAAPVGLLLGRLANFVNGELYGRVTDAPWAMVFPDGGPQPRHPSQLYEAGLEGIGLFILLNLLFHQTRLPRTPGLIAAIFFVGYALIRFSLEFVREPDAQLGILPIGLTMGQTLSAAMLIFGVGLGVYARGLCRR